MRALSTLSYSENVDLQRSAALAFAEITEKVRQPCSFSSARDSNETDGMMIGCLQDVREVSRETLEPILFLLNSHDVEVQRAASAALGNLGVNGKSPFLSPIFERILVNGGDGGSQLRTN